MELRLDGEVAIVTGAAQGIGRGVASGFVDAGASVVLVDKNPAVRDVVTAIRHDGGAALAIVADISDETEVEAAVADALKEFGTIDILVNNAAIDGATPIESMSLGEWREMLDVSLTSVFLCCRAVLPVMLAKRKGRIVNVGSQLALKGSGRLVHYCAAKAGVHGFTRALALEVADRGVIVNVVAPGPVETEMLFSLPDDWLSAKRAEMPLKRFASVAEIVPAIVFLSSPAASFFVGSTLNVSGGDVMA